MKMVQVGPHEWEEKFDWIDGVWAIIAIAGVAIIVYQLLIGVGR